MATITGSLARSASPASSADAITNNSNADAGASASALPRGGAARVQSLEVASALQQQAVQRPVQKHTMEQHQHSHQQQQPPPARKRQPQRKNQKSVAPSLGFKGLYEGELLKRPTKLSAYLSFSGWRERYCVADDDGFRYFARKGDPVPRRAVSFAGDCTITARGELEGSSGLFGFDLDSSGEVLSFASRSEKDISFWTKVLSRKIRDAALRSGSPASAHVKAVGTPQVLSPSAEAPKQGWFSRGNAARKQTQAQTPAQAQAQSRAQSELQPQEDTDDEGEVSTGIGIGLGEAPPVGPPLHGSSRLPGDNIYIVRGLRETLVAPAAVAESEGWRLLGCAGGVRASERETAYAGNSATDINARVRDLVGPMHVRAQTVVAAPAAHVFAMAMDLSASRREWDASFAAGSVVEAVDAHTDVVQWGMRPLVPYLVAARTFRLRRHWWRRADGAYVVLCTTTAPQTVSIGSSGGGPCMHAWYAVVCPSQSGAGCGVTFGVLVDFGGWMQLLRPACRAAALRMLDGAASLKRLADSARLEAAWAGDDSRDQATVHRLAFVCDLQLALEERDVDVGHSGEGGAGARGLVATLRELVTELCTLTPHQRGLARKRLAQRRQEARRSGILGRGKHGPVGAVGNKGIDEASEQGGGAPGQEMDYRYGMPQNAYLVPAEASKDGTSSWRDSGIEEGFWRVRGPAYLRDRKKIPNETSAMELLQVQWAFFDQPKRNIAADPVELVQLQHAGRRDRPFLLVINFMVPTVGNWVIYLAKRRTVSYERFDTMLAAFIDGDDAYRNARFKIIPSVVSGSYLAKRGIGSTPAILGKKIETQYYKGDNWFEVCVDVGSSRVAGSLMGVVKTYASSLVMDLAFLLEAQAENELPEVLIGGCRMTRPIMAPIKDMVTLVKSAKALEQARWFPSEAVPPEQEIVKEEAGVEEKSEGGQEGGQENRQEKEQGEDGYEALEVTANIEGGDEGGGESEESGEVKEDVKELDYVYAAPSGTYLVEKALSKAGKSAWCDSGSEVGFWRIRGSGYLSDRVKVRSAVSAMELVQVQWSFSETAKRHVCADPQGLVQQQHTGRADRPFLFVVNFMVPGGMNFVGYFARRRDEPRDAKFEAMLRNFIDGDDAYRNARLKIIPTVCEGYFLARKAIGSTPAILGKKIDTQYYKGDNYMEVCVDVGSSSVADGLMGVVKSYATSMVLDLAFLFESQTPQELPERILGGCRLFYPLVRPIGQPEFEAKFKA